MSQLEHLLQHCTVKLSVPGRSDWGTGFFVAPGWILTCAHVVKEAKGEPVQVRWQNQENWAQAVVESSISDRYDLALLQVTPPANANPPCVYLDEEIRSRDPLYLFGYPDEGDRLGEPRTFNCDGLTGGEIPSILFNLGQVRPGMSGSPLLNQRTGKVCGIVKFTRDRSLDMGGGAIPTHVILEQFPELKELQWEFHRGDRRWSDLLPAITSQSEMLDAEAVQSYLRSLSHYEQWWDVYRLTETISARQATFTFEQIVQTEEPSKENPTQKKTTPWPLLQGIIHYAKLEHVKSECVKSEHVLLVGSPGAGKSTTLLRLLAVLAKQELQNKKPCIPVLVKLKDYQKPVSGAEDSSGMLTLIKEALEPELFLEISEIKTLLFEEKRLFLLLDGLNEIPADIIRSKLTEFRANCDRANIPLVCTTRNLGETLGIQRRLELQTLSPREIRRFLRECMLGQEEQILKLLNKGNQELGKTPFILWMLYDVYKESGQIPESLGEAFSNFTKSYTNCKNDQEGIPVSAEDLQYWNLLLEYLAFEMLRSPDPHDPGLMISEKQATGMLLQFPSTEAIDQKQAQALLNNLLKYHLLQKSHKGEVSFCHQLIQEYYAAEHLLQQLPTLLEDENKFQRDYLNYLKWTEAIALMLSLPEVTEKKALHIVHLALEDIDLRLGARLAGEVKQDWQEKTIDLVLRKANTPRFVVYLCGVTRSDQVIPILRKILTDNISEVDSHKIIEALGKSSSERSIKVLGEILECEHFFLAAAAARILGSFGQEAVLPLLSKALHNKESYTRVAVVSALGEIGNITTISDLLLALEDNDSRVKWEATSALVRIGGEAVAKPLLQILITSNNFHTQKYVAIALGKLGYAAAIPGLSKALEDSDSQVIAGASYALATIGNQAAILWLTKSIMEQNDRFARIVMIDSLKQFNQKLTEEFVIPYFVGTLQAADPYVRSKSVEVLGRIGNQTVISKLLEAMEDEVPLVCWHSALALGEIGNQDAIPTLLQLLNKDLFHWESITIALGLLGYKYVVSNLQRMLRYACPEVCFTVLKALRIIGSPEAIQILLHESKNQTAEIRHRAVYEIGLTSNSCKIAALRQASLSEDPSVCEVAIRTLGKEGDKNEQRWLIQALQRNSHQVRAAAAEALGEIGDEESVPYLLEAFEAKSPLDIPTVFPKVSEALGKLGDAPVLPFLKNLLLKSNIEELFDAIAAIQDRCKFYNYKIWQEVIQNQEQTQKMASEPRNNFSGAIFNAPVNFGDNPTGDFIGTQNNYVTDPEVQSAIADLQTLVTQLQAQHPQVTTESQALDIIDAEFTEIKQSKIHRLATLRKQLLNPERHLQATKAAFGEVAKHYLEESVWAKTIITYLDKLSESPNHGA